jgi:DNA-binding NtrC family response regulator
MGVQEGQRKRFTPRALERLVAWPWPGNVRELRNVVQRAWVMALDEEIDEEWLPIADSNGIGARPEGGEPLHPRADGRISIAIGSQLADIERQVILATFEHCGRHRERTAAVLGISMKTLYNRLKEYNA